MIGVTGLLFNVASLRAPLRTNDNMYCVSPFTLAAEGTATTVAPLYFS